MTKVPVVVSLLVGAGVGCVCGVALERYVRVVPTDEDAIEPALGGDTSFEVLGHRLHSKVRITGARMGRSQWYLLFSKPPDCYISSGGTSSGAERWTINISGHAARIVRWRFTEDTLQIGAEVFALSQGRVFLVGPNEVQQVRAITGPIPTQAWQSPTTPLESSSVDDATLVDYVRSLSDDIDRFSSDQLGETTVSDGDSEGSVQPDRAAPNK